MAGVGKSSQSHDRGILAVMVTSTLTMLSNLFHFHSWSVACNRDGYLICLRDATLKVALGNFPVGTLFAYVRFHHATATLQLENEMGIICSFYIPPQAE